MFGESFQLICFCNNAPTTSCGALVAANLDASSPKILTLPICLPHASLQLLRSPISVIRHQLRKSRANPSFCLWTASPSKQGRTLCVVAATLKGEKLLTTTSPTPPLNPIKKLPPLKRSENPHAVLPPTALHQSQIWCACLFKPLATNCSPCLLVCKSAQPTGWLFTRLADWLDLATPWTSCTVTEIRL